MNLRVPLFVIVTGGLGMFGGFAQAQNAAPAAPPPPQLVKDKAAAQAAAIQAPQPLAAPRVSPLAAPLVEGSPGQAKILTPAPPPASAAPKLPNVRPAAPSPPASLKMNPPPADLRPVAPRLPPVVGGAPAPAVPEVPRATPPPVPSQAPVGMTKTEALEAVTKPAPMGIEAPRIPTRSDKIPVVTSTSASGQFRVHGNDLSLRSRMSSHLDDIAKELRAALKDGDQHLIPVNVRLSQGEEALKTTSAGAPPVGIQITEVEGGGFHLQLDIRDVPALKLEDIRRETVRILLAERILRGHATATPPKDRLLLPDWVFTGTLQTLDFRAAERPATMFAAIFKSGRIYGIEEIIEASPMEMDSLSRAIYETSCGALVMALVEQPDGGKRFNKFLNTLPVNPKPERELLNEAFPGFAASTSSLNKWWSLQLASLAKRRAADPLNADETIRALEEAVIIRYVAKTDEVPKDIKKRPFEVPTSPFVAPPSKPKAAPPTLDELAAELSEKSPEKKSPAKSTSKSKAAAADAEDDASVSKKEGSPWLRYLTFGLMGSKKDNEETADDDKVETKDDAEKKPAVAKADMPPETSQDEETASMPAGSPGFLDRLMSRNNINAAAERQKAADELARAKKEKEKKDAEAKEKAENEAAKKEKPEPEPKKPAESKPKDEAKPADKERGSLINPLNWFRGGKKPAEDDKDVKKDEKPKPDAKPKKSTEGEGEQESSAWMPWLPSPIAIVNWHVAPLAELWSHFSPWQARHAFLDFLKRKKPKEEEDKAKKAAEPEKPNPAPTPAKKKAEPKAEAKTSPKTTNPNAKPAARPVKPADGSQRTTNPLAKPVPVPQPPPATTASGDDELPTLPPGSQYVEIHIEDYQHILKRPDRVKILEKNAAALRALHQQASILMRPVVNGYLSIVLDLQEGKTKDIDKRLKDLRGYVTLTAKQTKAVRDYVDYYEANETEQLSGAFDDFLNLRHIIERELPPREDPIARYLDAIDKEFNK